MSAPLTDDDKGFIRNILDHPEELTTWLAYADWLDDRGDPRSEFLRLSAERVGLPGGDPRLYAIDDRLGELRRTLDQNWMLVFDTARLANCRAAGWRFVCPLTWDQLSPTDEPDIRICHTCKSPVFYCNTAEEARQYAGAGQCVALSSRLPAPVRGVELEPPPQREVVLMGFPSGPPADDSLMSIWDQHFNGPQGETAPATPPAPRRPWWKFW